jgi:hypothetical protein
MSNATQVTARRPRGGCASSLAAAVLALAFGATGPARAEPAKTLYPDRAPIEQYRSASQADEIALAKSAAPAAISNKAEILTMGAHGYEIAVKGTNGFVCMVLRSFTADFDDPVFWNPKIRGPICLNPAAARTVLPIYVRRTEWVLAGASKAEMIDRTKAAIAAGQITAPEVGAMSYMMSKDGYLDDTARHWHPHLMLFLPRVAPSEWGANVPAGAVIGDDRALEPMTVFFIPLPKWSDGTPEAMAM